METIEQNHFLGALYAQLGRSLITTVVVVLIYLILSFLLGRQIKSKRSRRLFKARFFYVSSFIFFLLMARIWFQGFTTILAVIGVVLASFVVTNKESIMNFTGWLIIQWRDLFTEGDHVLINHFHGKVQKIGMLYMTLLEYIEGTEGNATGRIIRLPNSFVITSQVINYSQTSHFLAQTIQLTLALESDIRFAMEVTLSTVKNVLSQHYRGRSEYTNEFLSQKNPDYAQLINFEPWAQLRLKQEAPRGIQLTVYYYCFAIDHELIERKIWLNLLNALQKNSSQINLAV